MPRTGGDITRRKILKTAEQLFSEKGFNGTSIDAIAVKVGIHKASIFYHFKNKKAIIDTLYRDLLRELDEQVGQVTRAQRLNKKTVTLKDQIKMEVEYLAHKKSALSIMLREALKKGDGFNTFFKYACNVITKEHGREARSPKLLTHEFFTALVPLIAFIVFRDKWGRYIRCSDHTLLEYFLDSFDITHLRTQHKL
jgi:AcrR family transcriptional regulator